MVAPGSPLRRLILAYNAVLIPLAAAGLALTAAGFREDSMPVALLGIAITLASPLVSYIVVASRIKRLLGK